MYITARQHFLCGGFFLVDHDASTHLSRFDFREGGLEAADHLAQFATW